MAKSSSKRNNVAKKKAAKKSPAPKSCGKVCDKKESKSCNKVCPQSEVPVTPVVSVWGKVLNLLLRKNK
jgi:hypothetical protein